MIDLWPTAACFQETSLKEKDKLNINEYHQYNYTYDTGPRASGGPSNRVKNDVSQSKTNITTLQAIAVKVALRWPINICLYISHRMNQ